MKILIIVKTGIHDGFRAIEVDANMGGALLRAHKEFRQDGEAWKVMLFDIRKRQKIYTLTA